MYTRETGILLSDLCAAIREDSQPANDWQWCAMLEPSTCGDSDSHSRKVYVQLT